MAPQAEAQWVGVEIYDRMKRANVQVKDAKLEWGKFYKGTKDHEISPTDVDKTNVSPGSKGTINSCGRADSASGTTGAFNLYDGDVKICSVSWDCPWGSKNNDFSVGSYDPEESPYAVVPGDWNRSGGAIGNVSVTVAMLG